MRVIVLIVHVLALHQADDLDPMTMTTFRVEVDTALLEVLRWTDAACYRARELRTLAHRRLATLVPPDWLSSLHLGLAVRVLIGYGILSLLVAAFCPQTPPKPIRQPSVTPLAALLRLIVPRTSLWPPILISITTDAKTRARQTDKRVIYLPLDTVFGLLEDGSITLRNPQRDAQSLVKGKAHFGGWDIEFTIYHGSWWWRYPFWWLNVNFKALLSPSAVGSILNSGHELTPY
jgi:hypothetical protein